MNADQGDAMEMRAAAQRYTGPSASLIASLIPHEVSFERGWFWTTTAVWERYSELAPPGAVLIL